jgi:hypothetical protein
MPAVYCLFSKFIRVLKQRRVSVLFIHPPDPGWLISKPQVFIRLLHATHIGGEDLRPEVRRRRWRGATA